MNPDRRLLLNAGAVLGAAAPMGEAHAQPPADYLQTPEPGKLGDFDFLTGNWTITNQRRLKPGEWDTFAGTATCFRILDGAASIEELRIPARDFSGMGLRVLDRTRLVWSDHWMNAKSGIVGSPGVTGGFVNGDGVFISEEKENGAPVKSIGLWDLISPNACRWRQGISRDGGKSFDYNWIMDWTRA